MAQPWPKTEEQLPVTTGQALFAADVAREVALMLSKAGVIDASELADRLLTAVNMFERDALHTPIHPVAVTTYAEAMRDLAATLKPAELKQG